jgi:hypothetical protein
MTHSRRHYRRDRSSKAWISPAEGVGYVIESMNVQTSRDYHAWISMLKTSRAVCCIEPRNQPWSRTQQHKTNEGKPWQSRKKTRAEFHRKCTGHGTRPEPDTKVIAEAQSQLAQKQAKARSLNKSIGIHSRKSSEQGHSKDR